MKTVFYFNGRRLDKKDVQFWVGRKEFRRMLKVSKQAYNKEARFKSSFTSPGGEVVIEFK